jgi:serine/threonine protein kinase
MSSSANHYTILEKVGSGSYGEVYEMIDKDGNESAVKQILRDNSGIPCLLEMIIMSSISHPYLNHANNIISTEKHINIIQEKAISDLSSHTYGKVLELDLVRLWFHMISQSLSCLHYLDLIHADIKAGNVLYFDDGDIRLADFTLTTKKWSKDDQFSHPACTYGHCPPEVLMLDGWDEKVDIWSLGCFFYEVAFGIPLFPNQIKLEDKKEVKRRYYNAIAEWLGYGLLGSANMIPVMLHPHYTDPKYSILRDLIEKMLKFDPNDRINIDQVLGHPFFSGLTKLKAEIREPVDNDNITSEIENRLIKTCEELLIPMKNKIGEIDTGFIIKLACKIFKKVSNFSSAPVPGGADITVVTCCWIASKIFSGEPPLLETPIDKKDIIRAELEMCIYLSFCLPVSI